MGMKRIDESQKSVVVDILARSFDENKSVNYVVKQDADRRQRVRALMEYSFNVCNAFGDVWMSADEQACALVLYPDKKRLTLPSILWDLKLALFVIGTERVNQVLTRESKIKAFHPKGKFTYLWFIGVSPELQGEGHGSQLLMEIISQSDSQGRPIYLETSVERNLPWYQKHGFEIFNSVNLSYALYLLRRTPV